MPGCDALRFDFHVCNSLDRLPVTADVLSYTPGQLFPASYRRFAGSMRNLRRRRDLISPEEINTIFGWRRNPAEDRLSRRGGAPLKVRLRSRFSVCSLLIVDHGPWK